MLLVIRAQFTGVSQGSNSAHAALTSRGRNALLVHPINFSSQDWLMVSPNPPQQPTQKPAESAAGIVANGADTESGRERVVRAAYDLFSQHGTRAVGVDTVIAQAGVAKMTLYRNFASKDDLILAFLQRREVLWTHGWVQSESQRRGDTPARRLLAIFEIFGEWFAQPGFEGCSFITTLLEVTNRDSPVRLASIQHLANIRSYLCGLAATCVASRCKPGWRTPIRLPASGTS